jgi:hypothetical protein
MGVNVELPALAATGMVMPRKGELSSTVIWPERIWPFIQSNKSLRVMLVKSVCLTLAASAFGEMADVAAASVDAKEAPLLELLFLEGVRWLEYRG